jgi:hypothetical protein
MNRRTLKRWLPVALCVASSLALLVFAFLPFNGRAREQSRRAAELAHELDLKIQTIEALPQRQTDLNKLMEQLGRFRSSLSGTHELAQVMADFKRRADLAGLDLWTMNPSVPVLVTLEAGGDSLSRLDLAVLPFSFECRGDFLEVGRFLQAEEARSDFCRWTRLTVVADPYAHGVQARGEAKMFLIPGSQTPEDPA